MLVLGVVNIFIFPPPPPAPNAASQSVSALSTQEPPQAAAAKALPAEMKTAAKVKTASLPVTEIRVETDDYIATFSNQGAVMTSYELKKYPNRVTHQPFQLVNPDLSRPKPFTVDFSPMPDLSQKVFQVVGSSQTLSKDHPTAKLVFRYVDENGRILEKSFGFQNGDYLIDFGLSVGQTGHGETPAANLEVEWADTLGQEENTGTQSRVAGYKVATLQGDHLSSEGIKKDQTSVEIQAPVQWTALANQFFVAALIPDTSSGAASAKVLRDLHPFNAPTQENPNPGLNEKYFTPRPVLVFAGTELRGGETFERKAKVFLGPQDFNLLKSLGIHLESVVDFGMFGFISVYMLALLKWFFAWCHNWGLAILFLSVLVKLVLWLPTHSSYKNMFMMQKKTKELQPKLDAIKRKYANDKQKQQQETMALYQQAGMNPLGGCLPMLFQLPVFYALYGTLYHSIELRGASFLWIHDLTLKDPTHVFPLLMGATMFVQQKVSGQMATQAAGQQKMMMWMMPVVLTFISFQWPAGLLVYWVVTNLLSMIQQKVVSREIQKAKKKDEGVKS